MEDRSPRRRRGASNKRLILVAAGIAVGIVAFVAAVSVFVFFQSLSRPGEATARFIPSNAVAYASINLRPGVQQLRHRRGVISTLQTDALVERRDELLDELEDETGIHFLDDVTPWLGESVSFALLDVDDERDTAEWVAMVHVSDRVAALDFAEDLVSYIEEESLSRFSDTDYREAHLWLSDDEDLGFALTEEYLLIADGENTLKRLIRDIESPPDRPLLADEDFTAARESLPSQRVMFMFVRSEWIWDLLRDELGPFDDEDETILRVESSTPEYAAMSASFIERGMRVDFAAERPDDGFTTGSGVRLASPEALPADTLVLLATNGVREAWEELRQVMDDLDPNGGSDFQSVLDEVEIETGIDVEEDVVGSLNGEIALALLPSDFLETGVYEGLLLAGVQDAEGIRGALKKLADIVEDSGVELGRSSLGEYEVVTAELEGFDLLGEDYEPGYLVTDNWAVLGSTRHSLEAFHDAVTGESEPLSEADEFSRLISMAPVPSDSLIYADLAAAMQLLEDSLDSDMRSGFRRDVKPFVEQLKAFLLAGSFTEEAIRFTAILTLSE